MSGKGKGPADPLILRVVGGAGGMGILRHRKKGLEEKSGVRVELDLPTTDWREKTEQGFL